MPLSWNLGTLTSWNPLGHSKPVTGLLYLYSLRGMELSNYGFNKRTFMYKLSLAYCCILFSSTTIETYTTGEKVTSFVSSGSYKSWSGGGRKDDIICTLRLYLFLSYLSLLRRLLFRATSLGRLSTKCIIVFTAQTSSVCLVACVVQKVVLVCSFRALLLKWESFGK